MIQNDDWQRRFASAENGHKIDHKFSRKPSITDRVHKNNTTMKVQLYVLAAVLLVGSSSCRYQAFALQQPNEDRITRGQEGGLRWESSFSEARNIRTLAKQRSDNNSKSRSSCNGPADGDEKTGVFVNLNQVDQNQVASFQRMCDGSLVHVGNYDTGKSDMVCDTCGFQKSLSQVMSLKKPIGLCFVLSL